MQFSFELLTYQREVEKSCVYTGQRFHVHWHRTIQPTEETRLPTHEELYGGGG